MPKLFKILRSRKATTSGENVKKSAIFRRSSSTTHGMTNGKRSFLSSNKKPSSQEEAIGIVPTVTFSLSEDEGSDVILSPVSDIENQFQQEEADVPKESKTTMDVSVGTEQDNETMTFTHLEIMRNQLNHMMELAERDKEISALQKCNEEMTSIHAEEMARKDFEILNLKEALLAVETALSKAEGELLSLHKEQSSIIQVLMKTQCELHELKSGQSSWYIPFMSFFDFN
jgi:hypothetical protein